jgi:hypothetical protein
MEKPISHKSGPLRKIRNPKSEIRKNPEIRNPKGEGLHPLRAPFLPSRFGIPEAIAKPRFPMILPSMILPSSVRIWAKDREGKIMTSFAIASRISDFLRISTLRGSLPNS